MNATKPSLTENLRIIWIIASKDILDAIRNKTTLSVIITVLFLVVVYRFLPAWESGDLPPRLSLYDGGNSHIVPELEKATKFDVFVAPSAEIMEIYAVDKDMVILGISLPENFDQMVASKEQIELQGHIVHWASDSQAAEVRAFFENQLSDLIGKQITINLEGNTIYTQPSSRGYAFLTSLGFLIAFLMVGISLTPNLMLEEKRTQTVDAILVSPASNAHLIAGKAIAGLFFCLSAAMVILIFNVPLITQWGLAILAVICASLFAVSLGLLLGTLFDTRGQIVLWVWILFAGLIIPVFLTILTDLLPGGLTRVLSWLPTVAIAKTFRASFSDSAPYEAFVPGLVLNLGSALLLLAAVIWILRRQDQ